MTVKTVTLQSDHSAEKNIMVHHKDQYYSRSQLAEAVCSDEVMTNPSA